MNTADVTLRKLESTTASKRPGHGEVKLARYAVMRDGIEIGQVFQRRTETTQRYTGKMYGYVTASTRWAWEADNMGDYEFPTRKAALEDLLMAI